jgi:hypothetical protein
MKPSDYQFFADQFLLCMDSCLQMPFSPQPDIKQYRGKILFFKKHFIKVFGAVQ